MGYQDSQAAVQDADLYTDQEANQDQYTHHAKPDRANAPPDQYAHPIANGH